MVGSPCRIQIRGLSVRYGDRVALSNVDLEVREREVLAIIGPANSGKSSLLLALNRMIERIPSAVTSGDILLDGDSITQIRDVEALRRRIGMVYAMPIPLPMSIRDNVLFGQRLNHRISNAKAEGLLESTLRAAYLWDEVKDRLDSSAQDLSGGQQQRLCIARTLATGPEVVLLDEPCSGLDPISTAKVEEALKELKQTHTVVLVTNNTKQAARVGDRTAFLLMGELVEVDQTERLFTTPSDKRTGDYIMGRYG